MPIVVAHQPDAQAIAEAANYAGLGKFNQQQTENAFQAAGINQRQQQINLGAQQQAFDQQKQTAQYYADLYKFNTGIQNQIDRDLFMADTQQQLQDDKYGALSDIQAMRQLGQLDVEAARTGGRMALEGLRLNPQERVRYQQLQQSMDLIGQREASQEITREQAEAQRSQLLPEMARYGSRQRRSQALEPAVNQAEAMAQAQARIFTDVDPVTGQQTRMVVNERGVPTAIRQGNEDARAMQFGRLYEQVYSHMERAAQDAARSSPNGEARPVDPERVLERVRGMWQAWQEIQNDTRAARPGAAGQAGAPGGQSTTAVVADWENQGMEGRMQTLRREFTGDASVTAAVDFIRTNQSRDGLSRIDQARYDQAYEVVQQATTAHFFNALVRTPQKRADFWEGMNQQERLGVLRFAYRNDQAVVQAIGRFQRGGQDSASPTIRAATSDFLTNGYPRSGRASAGTIPSGTAAAGAMSPFQAAASGLMSPAEAMQQPENFGAPQEIQRPALAGASGGQEIQRPFSGNGRDVQEVQRNVFQSLRQQASGNEEATRAIARVEQVVREAGGVARMNERQRHTYDELVLRIQFLLRPAPARPEQAPAPAGRRWYEPDVATPGS